MGELESQPLSESNCFRTVHQKQESAWEQLKQSVISYVMEVIYTGGAKNNVYKWPLQSTLLKQQLAVIRRCMDTDANYFEHLL